MEASLLAQNLKVQHLPLKRTFDIAFSTVVLAFIFPLFMLIAILVRLSSKGPAIYAHERVGRGGKSFKCLKFRSMYPDADIRLKQLLANDPEIAAEWNATFKLKNDPRITPIGKFLRQSSLDELPQFLNVLKGDLSVVGPRPVVKAEVQNHLKEKAAKILSVRPGITGLWQVSGRSNTSYEARILLDEHYIENHSFFMDLMLVLKTLPAMISRRGAY